MRNHKTPGRLGRELGAAGLKTQLRSSRLAHSLVRLVVELVFLFGLIAATGLGCSRSEPPLVPSRFFSPCRPFNSSAPDLISATGSRPPTGAEWERVNELLDQAVAQPSSYFAEIVATEILAQSESLFFQAGRGSELVRIYLDRVLENGPTSTYGPRLAFFYNLLGYRTEARDLLEHAFEAGVDSADLHFAWAFLLADENEFSSELLIDVARHLLMVSSQQTDYQGILNYDQAWLDETMSQLSPLVLDVAARGLTSVAQEQLHQAIPDEY